MVTAKEATTIQHDKQNTVQSNVHHSCIVSPKSGSWQCFTDLHSAENSSGCFVFTSFPAFVTKSLSLSPSKFPHRPTEQVNEVHVTFSRLSIILSYAYYTLQPTKHCKKHLSKLCAYFIRVKVHVIFI